LILLNVAANNKSWISAKIWTMQKYDYIWFTKQKSTFYLKYIQKYIEYQIIKYSHWYLHYFNKLSYYHKYENI
jgi:hypothetical protein